jgi:hypothetical protein
MGGTGGWRGKKDGPGRDAKPQIERCFVFRCEEGMVFINYGAPRISNCVIADCDNGIHYLHTTAASFPVIDHCLILRAKQGIVNRSDHAAITNTILSGCEKGLVIWAQGAWPLRGGEGKLRCDHTAFWSEGDPKGQKAILTYAYRDKQGGYQPIRPKWFRKIVFTEVRFRRPHFEYPPQGDWRLVDGSALIREGSGGGPIGLKIGSQ